MRRTVQVFIVTMIIGICIILAYGLYSFCKESSKNSEIVETVNEAGENLIRDSNESINASESKDSSYGEINDKYVVEEGFLSTVDSSGSIEEIIEKNNLQEDNRATIKEKLLAKNVAENFVQAICSFDIDKSKETVDLATKYIVDEKKEEIEALYIYLGKNRDIKKTVMESVVSREVVNREGNDYIIFKVKAEWSVVDDKDKNISKQHESYEVSLVKIDDKYKIIQYRIT